MVEPGTDPTNPDSKTPLPLLPLLPFPLLELLLPPFPWSSAQALQVRHAAKAAIVSHLKFRITLPLFL
jgi:hypothetical protein